MREGINKVLAAVLVTLLIVGSSVQDSFAEAEARKQAVQELSDSWLQPSGIWATESGDLIIVDTANHMIEKLDSNREQSWITGGHTGTDRYEQPVGGYIDTRIEQALYSHPRDVVVDSKGIVYISDSGNHTIRKIVDGIVYTHAGTGEQGYADGSKSKAKFNHPSGMIIDAEDNLYVADTMNHVIRKITPAGEVTTFAGQQASEGGLRNGSSFIARFNEPADVVIDEAGTMYVSDSGNQLIRAIADHKVTTFAGVVTAPDEYTGYREGGYRNGDRSQAKFNFPKGLLVKQGILFIADSMNHRIRAILPDGKTVNVAGAGQPGDRLGGIDESQFNMPVALDYAKGQLLVADSYNGKVKSISINLDKLETVNSDADIIDSVPLEEQPKATQVWFDYERITFNQQVLPYEADGKQYVPVRDLFEQWQAEVVWHKDSFEVELLKKDWSVRIKLGTSEAPIIKGKGYVELAYLASIAQLRTIEVEEHNAIIILSN